MKYLINILICSFFSLGMFAQDNSSTDSIIRTLEQRVLTLENQKELLDGKFENQKGELENQFTTYKNEVDVSVNEINTFFWILGILGFIGIFGLVCLFFYVGFKARKVADAKLEAIFNEESVQLANVIRKESLEEKLKTSSQLLVVYSDTKSRVEVDEYFTQMKFPRANINYRDIHKEIPSLNKYDLVVQAIGEDVDDAAIQKYLDLDGKYFVVYFKGRKAILNNYRHNSSIANSKFTLYHHIMNTLKYMDSSGR